MKRCLYTIRMFPHWEVKLRCSIPQQYNIAIYMQNGIHRFNLEYHPLF